MDSSCVYPLDCIFVPFLLKFRRMEVAHYFHIVTQNVVALSLYVSVCVCMCVLMNEWETETLKWHRLTCGVRLRHDIFSMLLNTWNEIMPYVNYETISYDKQTNKTHTLKVVLNGSFTITDIRSVLHLCGDIV